MYILWNDVLKYVLFWKVQCTHFGKSIIILVLWKLRWIHNTNTFSRNCFSGHLLSHSMFGLNFFGLCHAKYSHKMLNLSHMLVYNLLDTCLIRTKPYLESCERNAGFCFLNLVPQRFFLNTLVLRWWTDCPEQAQVVPEIQCTLHQPPQIQSSKI